MVDLDNKLCFRQGNNTYVAYGNTTAVSNALVVRMAGVNHYFPLIAKNSEYGAQSPFRKVNLLVRKNNADYNVSSNGVTVTVAFSVSVVSQIPNAIFTSVSVNNNGLNKAMSVRLSLILIGGAEKNGYTQSVGAGETSVSLTGYIGGSRGVRRARLSVTAPSTSDPSVTATYTTDISISRTLDGSYAMSLTLNY